MLTKHLLNVATRDFLSPSVLLFQVNASGTLDTQFNTAAPFFNYMLAGYQIHSSTLCLGGFNNVPVFIACNRLHEFHKSLNRTLKAFAFQICARNWHKPDISLCLTYVSKLCTEKYRERRGKKMHVGLLLLLSNVHSD